MGMIVAWFTANGVAFLAGAFVMFSGGQVAKWLARQFSDAKTHLPNEWALGRDTSSQRVDTDEG